MVRTPLSEALSSALSVIQPLALRRQIRIHFDLEALSDLVVLADPIQLKSVLTNLLSNAVKYQTAIRAKSSSAPGGSRTAKYGSRFADTGPGMPDQAREAAFQPFNRLGAEGSHIEGTGLGLTITERLIQMMSGSLGFESVPGQGSTFWVDLLPMPPPPKPEQPPPPEAGKRPARVPPRPRPRRWTCSLRRITRSTRSCCG